jgi:anti-sigma regulatory factor (Ser/Thr protein kinase)
VRQAEVRFDGERTSVAVARHFVTELLESAGAFAESWTAAQVVSELATNAIVHADTDFVVRVTIGATVVRIAVTDYRPFVTLTERPFSTDDTTGRGLRLVDTLSRSWGVHTAESSKTVWCEILRADDGCAGRMDVDDFTDTEAITSTDRVAAGTATAAGPLARA